MIYHPMHHGSKKRRCKNLLYNSKYTLYIYLSMYVCVRCIFLYWIYRSLGDMFLHFVFHSLVFFFFVTLLCFSFLVVLRATKKKEKICFDNMLADREKKILLLGYNRTNKKNIGDKIFISIQDVVDQ